MKKIICIAFLCFAMHSAFTQLYVRANVGYNFPANSEQMGTSYYSNNSGQVSIEKIKGVYGSYGSGLSFDVGFGGSLNGALGFDIEAGYLVGKKNILTQEFKDPIDQAKTNIFLYSRSFQLAPTLTFTAGTGTIQPYTRIGPVIAVTKLTEETKGNETSEGVQQPSSEIKVEMTGGLSLGFKGTLGISFSLAEKIKLFTEANFIGLAYSPKEREITKRISLGVDILDTIPKDQRKIKFKDEVDFGDTGFALKEKYSMGSIGLQVGVKFML